VEDWHKNLRKTEGNKIPRIRRNVSFDEEQGTGNRTDGALGRLEDKVNFATIVKKHIEEGGCVLGKAIGYRGKRGRNCARLWLTKGRNGRFPVIVKDSLRSGATFLHWQKENRARKGGSGKKGIQMGSISIRSGEEDPFWG